MSFDRELDVKELICPFPVLRAKKALAEMQSGQILRILATDPDSPRDFVAFASHTGNQLLEQKQDGDVYEFFLQRK